MSTPEWMKKYKEIGQKGEEMVMGGQTDGDDDNKQEKEENKRKPELISSDSVSNRVSMFETSLRQMTGKLPIADPSESGRGDTSSKIESVNATSSTKEDVVAAVEKYSPSKPPSNDSKISGSTKGKKWRDRLTANKQKKKEQATDSELSPPLNIENDDNTNVNIMDRNTMPITEKSVIDDKNNNIDKEEGLDNYDTDDDAARESHDIIRSFSDNSNSNEVDDSDDIQEDDDIVREFSDNSNSNEESEGDDAVREADEIVRGFSENSDNSCEDVDDDVETRDMVRGVGALAVSASNNIIDDDNDEDEAVLMHSLSDSDEDIPLDDLFSTAASLDIRLETGQSLSTSLQRTRNYEDDTEITTVSSNLEIDSKEEEKGVERDNHLHVPTGVAAAIAGTSSPRSRTVLYSDNDTDNDTDIDPEEGQKVASMPMAPLTNRGILLLPYSTGKRKKNEDGVSVASDDITVGGGISKTDRAALIPNTGRISMLPYTVVKSVLPTSSPKKNPYKKYLCLCILFVLILIIIIAASVSFYIQRRNNNNLNNNNLPIPASPPSPSLSPIVLPSKPPTSSSTTTLEPKEGLLVEFDQTVVFAGQGNGDRFGSVISMTTDGTFMVVLSNSPTNPVQAFQQRRESPRDWFPILTFPVTNMSLSFGTDIDTAKSPDGSLVVAISSRTQIEVYKLIDGAWIELGQPLQWNCPSVSHTAMSLSSDASTLAAGYVNDDGDVISVNVYTYDVESLTWIPLGGDPLQVNSRTRAINIREGTILSISLALSGNGRVLTIEEWAVADIQVVVQNFEWNDVGETNKWSLMGSHLPIPFGPTSIALSNDGLRVAIVANTPGKGAIYDWDDKNDEWNLLGKSYDDNNNIDYFFPGGSSVALARNGSRIIIGDASMNKALIYDYSTETDTWLLITSFSGSDSTSYGAAVTMDETGSTIGIGAPTASKTNGINLGQVILYEAY